MDKTVTKLSFLVFLIILGACYWPGVHGDFIFDDYYNLKALGAFGPVDNLKSFLLYITSGIADPTGRPVSMLSFLWDANYWPAEPGQFKKTNILLHLLNSALLFRVLIIAELKLGLDDRRAHIISAVASAFWAANPFFVSTVLYVVQRHAMLPMTFVLLSWLCWARVEQLIISDKRAKAWAWAIFGVWGFTALAGLSKANGFLAPALILSSFYILNSVRNIPSPSGYISKVILLAPSVMIISYLIWQLRYGIDATFGREFTLGERLLTQPRVLMTYISEFFIPGSTQSGFYYGDAIVISKSIFNPPTTAISIIGLILSIYLSIRYRRVFPRLSLCMMWFITAHLVESSTIMLELYFEHRNYLPSIFLFVPLAHWLVDGTVLALIRKILIGLITCILLGLTYSEALVWSNPQLQAALWKIEDPNSPRNLIYATSKYADLKSLADAINRLKALKIENPDSINLSLGTIGAECQIGGSSEETWNTAYYAAQRDAHFNSGTFEWMIDGINISVSGQCENLDETKMKLLLNSFKKNAYISKNRSSEVLLKYLEGYFQLKTNNPDAALIIFNSIVDLNKDPYYALNQAALLGNAGQEELAIQHIKYYRESIKNRQNLYSGMQWIHKNVLNYFDYHEAELLRLEKMLSESNKSNLD